MEGNPKIFIATGVVTLVVLAGIKGFAFEASEVQRIASLENLRCALGLSKHWHPVLHTQGLELPSTLENIDLKRLCHFQSDDECKSIDLRIWQEKHEKAEVVAAKLLAGKVRLKSKKEIFEMLGAPSYKGPIPERFSFSKKDCPVWFYHIGATDQGLFVFLRKDLCVDAFSLSYPDMSEFEEAVANSMMSTCKGKTLAEISKTYGPPSSFRAASRGKSGTIDRNSYLAEYDTGLGSSVVLEYSKSICVGVSKCILTH